MQTQEPTRSMMENYAVYRVSQAGVGPWRPGELVAWCMADALTAIVVTDPAAPRGEARAFSALYVASLVQDLFAGRLELTWMRKDVAAIGGTDGPFMDRSVS